MRHFCGYSRCVFFGECFASRRVASLRLIAAAAEMRSRRKRKRDYATAMAMAMAMARCCCWLLCDVCIGVYLGGVSRWCCCCCCCSLIWWRPLRHAGRRMVTLFPASCAAPVFHSVPGRMYYPNELSSVYMERLQFRLLAFTFLSFRLPLIPVSVPVPLSVLFSCC